MLSNCPNCNQALRPGANFCSVCGFKIGVISGPTSGTVLLKSGPRLQVRVRGKADYEVSLTGTPISIGRDPVCNQVVVDFKDVSRKHAQVILQGGQYAVMDTGSSNGTYLRGQRIAPNQPIHLNNGDVIRVGDGAGNSVGITFLETEAPMSVSSTLDLGQKLSGTASRFTIGRDSQCDLPIPSPNVSRRHAEVARAGNSYTITDLGSANGTFVNGKRVRSAVLNPGDEVQIGPYKLIYNLAGFQKLSNIGSMRIDGVKLRKDVIVHDPNPLRDLANRLLAALGNNPLKKKSLLNDVSLSVLPKEFVAVVGGSGAGKSTLIDALNGFRRSLIGQVLVNGDNLYQNYDVHRGNLGYVPQSDILHTGLPVDRALRYTALLRLPPDTDRQTIEQRINQALQQVEMLPQAKQPITSLSGGQKKRVSIASELLSDPSLFFLDEPTSGLDPGLDKKMMFLLNTLADGGRTILLTTHATNNIIGQCDYVAFMAHGRLVYYGPPDRAFQFFNVTDFADIYSKLETPQDAQQWETQYHTSPEYQQLVLARQTQMQPAAAVKTSPRPRPMALHLIGQIRQFGILALRYLDLIVNDWMSLFILLAVMPIIGFLLLLIADAKSFVGDTDGRIKELLEDQHFYQIVTDSQKLLLMLSLSVILLGVFAAAYEIIKEKPIYRRERMVNLGIIPYLASKVAVLMGFGVIQCAALLFVVGRKVDIPEEGILFPALLEMFVSLMLAMLVGLCMGLLISALVQNSNMVIYLVLVVLFIQIIFSGALFSLPGPTKPFSAITPTRWAMEGLGATVDMERLNELSQQFIADVDGMELNKTVKAKVDFNLNYEPSQAHLLGTWFLQLFFAAVFLSLTAWILQKQDVQT